ncbi:hypothetical protein C8Q80DRAFT_1156266 [Daedaleopsis nitida]|nr:hypothetical protein C8Q80DRAFT_1156266 [Daedaleopsis nitida]
MHSTAPPPPVVKKGKQARRRVKKDSSSADEAKPQATRKEGRPSSVDTTSKGPRGLLPSVPLQPPHAAKERKQRRRKQVHKDRLGKDVREGGEARTQGSPDEGSAVKSLKLIHARPELLKPVLGPPAANLPVRSFSLPLQSLPYRPLLVNSSASPPQSSLLSPAEPIPTPYGPGEDRPYATSHTRPRSQMSHTATPVSAVSPCELPPPRGAVDGQWFAPRVTSSYPAHFPGVNTDPRRWNEAYMGLMLPSPQVFQPPPNSVSTWINGYTHFDRYAYEMPPAAIQSMQGMVPPMFPDASWTTSYAHYYTFAPPLPPISAPRRSWEKGYAPSYPLQYPPPYMVVGPCPHSYAQPMVHEQCQWNGFAHHDPDYHYTPTAMGPPPTHVDAPTAVPPIAQSTASYGRWSDDAMLDYPGRGMRRRSRRRGSSSPDRQASLDRLEAYASDMELEHGLYECGR